MDDLAAPGRLADELVGSGELTDWAWKQVFRNVPRHMFVPDWVWVPDHGGYRLIDGGSRRDRHEWLELVYSDQTLVTQLADGAGSGRERWAPGPPTSAATQPGLIARMLGELQAEPGSRVLHLGAGPGYMAALLAARLGDDQVVGVEADPQLAASARANLAAAGYQPLVVTGGAADGYPAAAPYDRVLATVPATRIPYAWVSQTRPGGRLVVAAHGALTRHGLAALTVGHDGTARGHYLPHTDGFISLSAQCHPDFGRLLHQTCDAPAGHTQRHTRCSPHRDRTTLGAWTVVETVLPEVLATDIPADDGTGTVSTWFHGPPDGSWACVDSAPDQQDYRVYQHGPRLLWDDIEPILTWWQQAGRPPKHAFGLTVTPHGQRLWLGHPDGPAWPARMP